MIYLDYAAHAPADPAVLERFCDMERRFTANPNSGHAAGGPRASKWPAQPSRSRRSPAQPPPRSFSPRARPRRTNLAIKGIAQASRHIGRHIISTPLEHSSVSGSLTALQERGWEIDLLSIGRDGTVDPEEVRELLRPDTVLVALCAVDSELGTVQPVREIAELLAGYPNCRLHVDATQAIGRIPVNFSGIDTMSFAPHKFGGLCGSGVLLKRSRMPLEPQMNGGASHDALPQRHTGTGACRVPLHSRSSSPASSTKTAVPLSVGTVNACAGRSPPIRPCISTARSTPSRIFSTSASKMSREPCFSVRFPKKASACRSNPPARRTACPRARYSLSAVTAGTHFPHGASA